MPYANADRQRAFQRRWVAARRAQYIASQGGSCAWCGVNDQPLQVDHRDAQLRRRTKGSTHRIWSLTPSRQAAELALTQLLCARCHVVKGVSEGDLITGAVLAPDDVRSIRVMASRGMPIADLADAFGVGPGTVRAAVAGRTWKHVTLLGSGVEARAATLRPIQPRAVGS